MKKRFLYKALSLGMAFMLAFAPGISAAAAEQGGPVPYPMVMDAEGNPVTDPAGNPLYTYNGQSLTLSQIQAQIAQQQAQGEAERQRQAQEEAERQRQAQEEAERQRQAQEEAERQRQAQEEAERQRKAQEETERQEEEERKKQEEESRRKQEEERKKKEEESRKRQEEEERRKQEEEESRKKQEEGRKKEDDDRRRRAVPEDDDYETAGKYGYSLKTSKDVLSFGNMSPSQEPKTERLVITNPCSVGITLNWTLTDPDSVFSVNSNGVSKIPSFGSGMIFIEADVSKAKEGLHQGTLLLGDAGDPSFKWGYKVDLAVNVVSGKPVVRGMSITPTESTLSPGASRSFGVDIWGDNNPSQEVKWNIEGARSRNTFVDSNGILNIANDESAASFNVKAISVQDSSFSATSRINVRSDSFSVTVSADPDKGGYVTGNTVVQRGGSARIVASANNGWRFDKWVINGRDTSAGNVYNLGNIRENINAVAKFVRTSIRIKVVSENTDYGTVDGGGEVAPGGKMTIKARPKDGYKFRHWERDGEKYSKDEVLQLTDINEDHKFVAIFGREKYNVTAVITPQKAGVVDGTGEYKGGKNVTLTAYSNNDYQFRAWMKDGKVIGTTNTLTIENLTKDYNITAAFEPTKKDIKIWNIEAGTTSSNGVITPAGSVRIPEGSGMQFTITPKAGYAISCVYVDGKDIGPVSSYTFNNVGSAHAIVAAFVQIPGQPQQPKKEDPAPKKENTAPQSDNTESKNTGSGSDNREKAPTPSRHEGNTNHAVSEQIKLSEDGQTTHYDETSGNEYLEYIVDDKDYEEEDEHLEEAMIEFTNLAGPLQELDILPEEARELIRQGNDEALMDTALSDDTIGVIVNNSYAHNVQETSAGNVGVTDPTIRNFREVVDSLLTEDEKISAYSGERISFSLNIVESGNGVDAKERKLIEKNLPSGMKVDDYFSVNFIKIGRGNVANIEKLEKEIEIRINVPEELKGKDEYSIVRNHNGEISVLMDLDDDPDTITFRTDRFSTYGIASHSGPGAITFVIVAIVILVCVAASAVVIVKTSKSKKHAKAKHASRGR